ncbi:M99 family carboxypeptidase catalytic domain-containing protein, partial [Campylobacter coli]
MKFFISIIFFISGLFALDLEFSVGENGKSLDDNNTVLIFGGIQGDEPGGFHAASLLLSDYNITKGKIIVAPNLAFDSIIKRSRGKNGDLNRKFA